MHGMRPEGGVSGGRGAVRVALLRDTAFEQRRLLRFAHDDLRIRKLLCKNAGHALERAASAIPGHPVIEPLAGKVCDDLARCGA